MGAIFLTEADLVSLTDRERPKAQARVLRAMGIPFGVHPVDGTLRVASESAKAWLGVPEAANEPEVNVDAIRRNRGPSQKADHG